MGKSELRDHAKQMLETIVIDLEEPQSEQERDEKAKGLATEPGAGETAAESHGTLREASGFTLSPCRFWVKRGGFTGSLTYNVSACRRTLPARGWPYKSCESIELCARWTVNRELT